MDNRQAKKIVIGLAALGVIAIAVIALAIFLIVKSGVTSGPDKMFGDQHLKTAVALIELHKVRYGAYPESLDDLKFVGDWDGIALNSVRYRANAERSAYYVEVIRGWVGKPDLRMPAEFWQGTGYDSSLGEADD